MADDPQHAAPRPGFIRMAVTMLEHEIEVAVDEARVLLRQGLARDETAAEAAIKAAEADLQDAAAAPTASAPAPTISAAGTSAPPAGDQAKEAAK